MKKGRNRFSQPICPVSAAELRNRFSYHPLTGAIIYRYRPVEQFVGNDKVTGVALHNQWNARFAAQPAFRLKGRDGYLWGKLNGHRLTAHRVAWTLHHGAWPEGEIDHINGVRNDNRIENLRLVDAHTNCLNQRIRSDNKSGYHGVRENRAGRWEASITHRGKRRHIGTFETVEEAAQARRAEEKVLGFHENHGRLYVPVEAALSRTVVIDTFSEAGNYAEHIAATECMRSPNRFSRPVHSNSNTDTGARNHAA